MPDFPSNQNLSDRARQRIDQMGPDYRHPDDSMRGSSSSVPSSLESQTPGLDTTRFFRAAGNRIVSWAREQPALVAGICLGTVAAGFGIFFGARYAHRRRRMSFFRNLYDKGYDRVSSWF